MPANFPEIWLERVTQTLESGDTADFLDGVQEIDGDVTEMGEENLIHVPLTEFSPDILINNKTYPIAVQEYTDVVYLVDPPYLSTDTKSYNSDSYWKLRDYLDVLNVLEGTNYFYFTSNKSSIIELCQWFETRTSNTNPFAGANMQTMTGSVNFSSTYQDIMLYKLQKNEK